MAYEHKLRIPYKIKETEIRNGKSKLLNFIQKKEKSYKK